MAGNGGEQTEKATPRRMQKAREEGNFPAAREFVSSLQFLLFVVLLGSWGPAWFSQTRGTMRSLLERAFHEQLTVTALLSLFWWIAMHSLQPLSWLAAALIAVTIAVQLIATGFGVSLAKLMPDLNRLNPVQKLSGLPKQNIPALVQALIMLPIFGYAVYRIARDRMSSYFVLPLGAIESSARMVGASFHDLLYKGAAVFFVFGCVTLFRQRLQYAKELRMSKQDIKDESKDADGNPQTKQRVRRIQRDMRRRQMMREVPKATAVIVNPTHYAVAIKYSVESMSAPTVVAKGKNYLALRIRTLAINNQVPIIENPPLAQALYKSAEVGQEIPAHLYRAVAEILAYIYKLMNGRFPN
jgi:flagellar biosynthetic protein FlhB